MVVLHSSDSLLGALHQAIFGLLLCLYQDGPRRRRNGDTGMGRNVENGDKDMGRHGDSPKYLQRMVTDLEFVLPFILGFFD